MTDRFVVPEPSADSIIGARAYIQAEVRRAFPPATPSWYIHDNVMAEALRAAYAVDVPALVRQEAFTMIRNLMANRPDPEHRLTEAIAWYEARYGVSWNEDAARFDADPQPPERPNFMAEHFCDVTTEAKCPACVAADAVARLRADPQTHSHQPNCQYPGCRIVDPPTVGRADSFGSSPATPNPASPFGISQAELEIEKVRADNAELNRLLDISQATIRELRSTVFTPAHAAFLEMLAEAFGENRTFAYTEEGDLNVRMSHNDPVAVAARALLTEKL